jgi:hypothetical protein
VRTDRQELEILRVSIARVAQAIGVETTELPVIDKSFNELSEMAKQDRGWNRLCAAIVCEIRDKE